MEIDQNTFGNILLWLILSFFFAVFLFNLRRFIGFWYLFGIFAVLSLGMAYVIGNF